MADPGVVFPLQLQVFVFYNGELKAEIRGEAGGVPFDDAVEGVGRNAEFGGEIEVQHDELSTDKVDHRGGIWIWHFLLEGTTGNH